MFLLQTIVRKIFFVQIKDNSNPLFPYNLNNNNNNSYDFKWHEPKTADEKCFITKSLKYEPFNSSKCFPRNKYKKLMACGINISPTSINQSHIAVIGSTGVLGNAITYELEKQQIPFIEIRSHFQYNINRKSAFKLLKEISISSVILLVDYPNFWNQTDFSYENLFQFCEKKKIPLFYIVRHFKKYDLENPHLKIVQIKSQPVWGPIFLTPTQQIPGNTFYRCFVPKQTYYPMSNYLLNESSKFVFSLDVASYVINGVIAQYFNNKLRSNRITIPELPSITNVELKILLNEKNCSIKFNVSDSVVSESNRKRFDVVWNSLQTEENVGPRQKQKAYASLVVCTSNKRRIVNLFSLSLQCTNSIINDYPNIAIEFLILFCSTEEEKKQFYSIFKVPEEMVKYMRIIHISFDYVEKIKKTFKIKYFPEFILKNIGIRRASGEYIFSINSDVILPIGFFESVQRKLFTPLSYIRSHRRMVSYKTQKKLLKYFYTVPDYRFQLQTFSDVCNNRRFYDDYDRNGCGDFQGAHRKMWFNVRGFIESKHVFHIDTALSMDFAAMPAYMFARVIGQNIHIEHKKESNSTDHFKFFNNSIKNAIRQGISTSMIDKYKRPHWGSEGIEFMEY